MSEIAIRVEGLSKAYQIRHSQARNRYRTLREDLVALAAKPVRRNTATSRETFWALDDVSFEVKHGEALGIIGRNGAGKSTLLKILSRITKPTRGTATVYGRVGSLLEVGTGFHPELTGRENIYLNGAILGMTKRDIQRHFDEIVAFAEIEQFLDTPVKRYSSGMYMRLAFAVAAHLEPEVLVVDEVLAVGDAAFQKKCLGKMSEVAHGGRTVLFVSHNMSAIQQLCTNAVLLSSGEIAMIGPAEHVIAGYLDSGDFSAEYTISEDELKRRKDAKLTIMSAYLSADGKTRNSFNRDEMVELHIDVRVASPISFGQIAFELLNNRDDCVFSSTNLDVPNAPDELLPGAYQCVCRIPLNELREGQYRVALSSSIPNIEILHIVEAPLVFEVVAPDSPVVKLAQDRRGIILPSLDWETHPAPELVATTSDSSPRS